MADRLFVVGDAHGNIKLVLGLLVKAGVLTEDLKRVGGVRSIHVGDLINGVASSQAADNASLAVAETIFDKVLIGNHEHPHLGGPQFRGFWPLQDVQNTVRRMVAEEFMVPAFLEENILITHAGVTNDTTAKGAADAYTQIMGAWRSDPTGPTFSAIGAARGGYHPMGGILWADYDEPKAKFNQIFGHTPKDKAPLVKYRKNGSFQAMIDCGGKRGGQICGVWVEDGKIVEQVFFDLLDRPQPN